jgi:hypothetical protein
VQSGSEAMGRCGCVTPFVKTFGMPYMSHSFMVFSVTFYSELRRAITFRMRVFTKESHLRCAMFENFNMPFV